MASLTHERTERGHVLHTNTLRTLLVMTIPMILLTAVMLCFAASLVEKEMKTTFIVLVGFCILCQILGMLSLVYLMAGRRLEIDRDGVHLRYKYRKGVSILWSEVRDWGLSSQMPVSENGPTILYFSKAELGLIAPETKNIPQNKQAVMIRLSAADQASLSRAGLFTFCKACLGEDAPEAFQEHLMNGARHED